MNRRDELKASRAAFWQQHIIQFSQQPYRLERYSREADICPIQFKAWRRRLKYQGWTPSLSTTSASSPPAFVAVEVSADDKTTPIRQPITIRLPSGFAIDIQPGFDPATLKAIISALKDDHVLA